jgi:hypothetical protein
VESPIFFDWIRKHLVANGPLSANTISAADHIKERLPATYMSNGEFFQEQQEHSLIKAIIVKKYFWSWANVIPNVPSL